MALQIEGASGLFFDPENIDGFSGVTYKLFTRWQTTPSAEWTYLGDYETIEAQPLSKVEWNEQKGKVGGHTYDIALVLEVFFMI